MEALEWTTVKAHPYCMRAHTHTVVKGSPAVHVDHDNTLEEELNSHCKRGGNRDVVSGGTDPGKKGWREERGESDNLGLRESSEESVWLLQMLRFVSRSVNNTHVWNRTRMLIVVFC